jgi:hypothetical protein
MSTYVRPFPNTVTEPAGEAERARAMGEGDLIFEILAMLVIVAIFSVESVSEFTFFLESFQSEIDLRIHFFKVF